MDAPMENVISTFRSEFLNKDKEINQFRTLLELADENILFKQHKKGALQEVISHIHSCLNTSKQRAEGLIFLERLAEQCVTEEFTNNAVTWIRFIIQCLESHDTPAVKNLACHVGCRILPLTVSFTAVNKDVTGLIPQLLSALLSADTQWLKAALKLVNASIEAYPGPCGTVKGKIEVIILELFKEESVPQEALTTYILLTSCGGGGNKGVKYTESWSNKCQQILASLDKVVTLLYEGLNVHETNTAPSFPTLPMRTIPEQLSDRFRLLASYFNTYTMCLHELLSQPFSAPVKIPVNEILQIIYKVLSVNNKILHARPSTERLILSGYIPAIHCRAVSCLHSLISRCKTLLLPHSKVIISVLVQELLWSQVPVTYGQSRPYSTLRQTVYQTLIAWLQTTQSFIPTTTEEEWLVQEIIHDCRPHTDNMKVDKDKRSSSFEPPPAKKKKKGGYSELSHGISSQRKIDMESNSELCVIALEALYWFLSTTGFKLKQKIVQEVQEFITSVAVTFRTKGNYGIPYTNDRCRYSLLRVIQAFNLMPHPSSSSILQYSLAVLRCSVMDDSLLVSSFSTESLNICEELVHARPPCFHMPKIVQREIMSDNDKDVQQSRTSESRMFIEYSRKPSIFDAIQDQNSAGDDMSKKNLKNGNFNMGSVMDDMVVNSIVKSDNLNSTDMSNCLKNGSTTAEILSNKSQESDCPPDQIDSFSSTVSEEDVIPASTHDRPSDQLEIKETDNQSHDMDVDRMEDIVKSSETVAIVTKTDESTEVTLQNEDEEDMENILSTFVDAETD